LKQIGPMIKIESDAPPAEMHFDVAIVAVGYERRCRWIAENHEISASRKLGLEFGFLREGSFEGNFEFFEKRSYEISSGLGENASGVILNAIKEAAEGKVSTAVFVDISSMSREMIANVVLGIQSARSDFEICVTIGYAPSKFSGDYRPAPIRRANPITPSLAGWSSQPERPLGAIFGLGCEPGLALGALQYLEPNKAWIFEPKGTDAKYDAAMRKANQHIADIFDVTSFSYEVTKPTMTRGRLEALLNAVDSSFRIIVVPFGPKIFAWLVISTVVFTDRRGIGIWAFSSKEQGQVVDRDADGFVIWHKLVLPKIEADKGSAEASRDEA
jgi:hypothetical protein